MSLPSLKGLVDARGGDAYKMCPTDREEILVAAMRTDLGEAITMLHEAAHQADNSPDGRAVIEQDPNSDIGKKLSRLCAGTALRELAERHFCHGKMLTFINCCKVIVGEPPEDLVLEQILNQDGTFASADC